MLLVALSAGSALLTVGRIAISAKLAGSLLLLLAFLKARLILLDYLKLRQAPPWASGFLVVVAIFVLLLGALFLAA
jgi:nitric oxide reductase NorF protein